MSENINNNNNIQNNINPENIETIDFDALESISASTSKAEVDIPSIEEMEEDSAGVGENREIDSIDSIDSDDSDNLINPVSLRSNLVDLNLIGELQEGEVKYLQIGEACIEVKSKLPYKKLFDAIQWAIVYLADGRPYVSTPLKQIISDIGFLKFFTNLDFERIESLDFNLEEFYTIYDFLESFQIMDKVKNFVDSEQINFYYKGIDETLESIISYQNSLAGIIEKITDKTANTADNINQELSQLKDEDTIATIKELLKVVDNIK